MSTENDQNEVLSNIRNRRSFTPSDVGAPDTTTLIRENRSNLSGTDLTVEEIRSQIAELEGKLSTIAGEGLEIWNGRDGDVRDCPKGGGATLTVIWAVEDHSYELWFDSTEKAKAALLKLARENGRVPYDSGFQVDLTCYQCHESKAYVTRLGLNEG